MPLPWHENTPHHISATMQQTSFSDYSTEGAAAILNFKVSLVFRFPYDGLITTSITIFQKYHNWKLGPKLEYAFVKGLPFPLPLPPPSTQAINNCSAGIKFPKKKEKKQKKKKERKEENNSPEKKTTQNGKDTIAYI